MSLEQWDMVDRPGLMTLGELRERLGCHRETVWKWLRRLNILTYRYVGDPYSYVRREDVDRLMAVRPVPRRAVRSEKPGVVEEAGKTSGRCSA